MGQGQEESSAVPSAIWKSIDLLSKKNLKYREIEIFKSFLYNLNFSYNEAKWQV